MIGGETVLAVIPARGGSKGAPRKNIRPLGGEAAAGMDRGGGREVGIYRPVDSVLG